MLHCHSRALSASCCATPPPQKFMGNDSIVYIRTTFFLVDPPPSVYHSFDPRLLPHDYFISYNTLYILYAMAPTALVHIDSERKLHKVASGKVRDLFNVDENTLLFVASDRISAYDVVMENGIPEKGAILTQMRYVTLTRAAASYQC